MSSTTTEVSFLSWGWRVPFLLSFVLVFVGCSLVSLICVWALKDQAGSLDHK